MLNVGRGSGLRALLWRSAVKVRLDDRLDRPKCQFPATDRCQESDKKEVRPTVELEPKAHGRNDERRGHVDSVVNGFFSGGAVRHGDHSCKQRRQRLVLIHLRIRYVSNTGRPGRATSRGLAPLEMRRYHFNDPFRFVAWCWRPCCRDESAIVGD
jgi:hypothetical protein